MNGRVYDYTIGRFMSVDPFIQEAGNSQSINPYSYVMNNPLGFTDPTGYIGSRIKDSEGEDRDTVAGVQGVSTKNQRGYDATKANAAFNGASVGTPKNGGPEKTVDIEGETSKKEVSPTDVGTSGILASDAGGLVNAAYPGNKPPEGWEAVTGKALKKQFGLTSEDMHTDEGLNVSIFYNEKSDVYALAFAGTDPSTYGNLKANFLQNFGFPSAQYKQALRVAGVFATNLGGSTGVFTGHSLGGGLASAAAITYGMRGYTFNAAGLHRNTVGGRIDYSAAKGLVNAYYSSSDPLSFVQDNRWVGAALSAYTKLPISFNPAVGRRIVVDGAKGHSMDSMYKALR